MWSILRAQYEVLGFSDGISDEEKIAEFKYINQQLRKYVFTLQDNVYTMVGSPDRVAAFATDKLAGASEEATTRQELVYNFVRDQWLIGLINTAAAFYNEQREEEENGNDY